MNILVLFISLIKVYSLRTSVSTLMKTGKSRSESKIVLGGRLPLQNVGEREKRSLEKVPEGLVIAIDD